MDKEFTHEAHIKECHLVPTSVVLGSPIRKPLCIASKRLLFGHSCCINRRPGRCIPSRRFPSTHISKECILVIAQSLMQRTLLTTTSRLVHVIGIVHLVRITQRFRCSHGSIFHVTLVPVKAVHVDACHITVTRCAPVVTNPLCQNLPMPPPVKIPIEFKPAAM